MNLIKNYLCQSKGFSIVLIFSIVWFEYEYLLTSNPSIVSYFLLDIFLSVTESVTIPKIYSGLELLYKEFNANAFLKYLPFFDRKDNTN